MMKYAAVALGLSLLSQQASAYLLEEQCTELRKMIYRDYVLYRTEYQNVSDPDDKKREDANQMVEYFLDQAAKHSQIFTAMCKDRFD